MIKTNITIKNDIAILDLELPSGVITPEDIVNLELPDAVKEGFADKLVVISGRAPIGLYCVIAFVYDQCKGVAVYDTRVNGAEIIQTNSKDYKLGQIVGIY